MASAAAAWTGPTGNPPSGNVSAPINVGTTNQLKNGNLGVNGLAVFGNSILQGGSYLNWGSTAGSGGYGMRDNAGTLEFKNAGGSWGSLQSIISNYVSGGGGGGGSSGSSLWQASGNDIANTNSGNVAIGGSASSAKLRVTNTVSSNWGAYISSPTYGAYVGGNNGNAYLGYNGYGGYFSGGIGVRGYSGSSYGGYFTGAYGLYAAGNGSGAYLGYGGYGLYTGNLVRADGGFCVGGDCTTSFQIKLTNCSNYAHTWSCPSDKVMRGMYAAAGWGNPDSVICCSLSL